MASEARTTSMVFTTRLGTSGSRSALAFGKSMIFTDLSWMAETSTISTIPSGGVHGLPLQSPVTSPQFWLVEMDMGPE